MGLEWRDLDLEARRLLVRQQVRHGRVGPLKDDESRLVLHSEPPGAHPDRLEAQDRGGPGSCSPPRSRSGAGARGGPRRFVQCHTLHKALRKALKDSGLPALTWYQSTRHTFASQFVLPGG
jgi:integrase